MSGGECRGAARWVSGAELRLASGVGVSHGAVSVSPSRPLASASDGRQSPGGATTIVRSESGASAAIIAVSARNRCRTANSVLSGRVPELVLPALSTPVRVLSERSTFMGRPATRSEATASSGWKTLAASTTGGISPLFSTTVPTCWWVARVVSTDRSAVPPGGQAMSCPTLLCSTLLATASPVLYAVARSLVRP